MQNLPVIKLEGDLYTDYSGIKRLFNFYHSASEYSNITIYIDFYDLNWIDANLCALLQSMLYKLNIENKLLFSADLNYISQKFNVLFRNGFMPNENNIIDENKSVIVLKNFLSSDKVGFINYVENELLENRGMPKFLDDAKNLIIDSLIELFNNIDIHSQTEYPFFVCGQYYPKQKKVVFSMVDLGVGFLPAINKKTFGEVVCSLEAIKWALEKGKTTKVDSPGGLGLYDLHSYCKKNKGAIQIVTGDVYWDSDLENTIFDCRKFIQPYFGSIINLFFDCN